MSLDKLKRQIANAIDMFECGFISAYELVGIIKTIMIKNKTSEQLCDNPNCEDGVADWDMYGNPIYCQVCDKHN